MRRDWPNLKVFKLSTTVVLEMTEDLLSAILNQCPKLQALILPWDYSICKSSYKTSSSDIVEWIYKLLAERKLKIFLNSLWEHTNIIEQLKKYEAYHVPLKQRIFNNENLDADIRYNNKNSTLLQKLLHFDIDIFGVKSY